MCTRNCDMGNSCHRSTLGVHPAEQPLRADDSVIRKPDDLSLRHKSPAVRDVNAAIWADRHACRESQRVASQRRVDTWSVKRNFHHVAAAESLTGNQFGGVEAAVRPEGASVDRPEVTSPQVARLNTVPRLFGSARLGSTRYTFADGPRVRLSTSASVPM